LNTTEVCGQLVRTLFGPKPCQRGLFHLGGHNPFSDTPPKLGKASEVLEPTVPAANDAVQNVSAVPAAESAVDAAAADAGDIQCIWQGTSGRCVLKQGHYPATPHREMVPDAFS
jgi:hypothetical protein